MVQTSVSRVLNPFWTNDTTKITNKLWLPTNSNCSNSENIKLNSWFTSKVQFNIHPVNDNLNNELTLLQEHMKLSFTG